MRTRVGCSGWNYDSWRGGLYPEGLAQRRWLERYAELFDTVEVNSTFYRLASRAGVERWVEQTPEDFVFAVKASQYLTHMKRLRDMETGVERFYERIQPLVDAGRLGPVVWQLPANFHRDDERLAGALRHLPPGRHCFEFRHESWFSDDVYSLLRDHGVALVIGDRPERPFQTHEMTADFTLVRFHYGARGRRGNYSETELDRWAELLRGWSRTVEVFAYFNNDWEEFAPRNARGLARRLSVEQVSPAAGREALLR
ncbi:MAG: DUF72 domain-containing protein [Actinomycetota bacterium]|nr:DUF72 domain-containing protein [Actinomycetota bacterium]